MYGHCDLCWLVVQTRKPRFLNAIQRAFRKAASGRTFSASQLQGAAWCYDGGKEHCCLCFWRRPCWGSRLWSTSASLRAWLTVCLLKFRHRTLSPVPKIYAFLSLAIFPPAPWRINKQLECQHLQKCIKDANPTFGAHQFPRGDALLLSPALFCLLCYILKRKNHLLFSDCVNNGVDFPVLKGIVSSGD